MRRELQYSWLHDHNTGMPTSSAPSEDVPQRPDIIDGFERKSVALLDYVNNLEEQLDELRASYEHKEARLLADRSALESELSQRLSRLLSDKKALEEKVLQSHEHHSRIQKTLLVEERKRQSSEEAAKMLKLDENAAQELLRSERSHCKELEEKISNLKEQIKNKDYNYNRLKLKDEREKLKLEEDMSVLKKKVSLGWILGCLSEVYLRLDDKTKDEKRDEVISDLVKNLERPLDLEAVGNKVQQILNVCLSPSSHRKKHFTSSKQVLDDDTLLGSSADLDFDSLGDVASSSMDNCKPCRLMRSALEHEHTHHSEKIGSSS
ncbi:hypothetical protein KP509_17G074500 [Ceratopteris richardii]|uniref:Uncharacterized protein n=1 Tax=Ceratopteris richardii TaxID=49495 RepID=A0A8T2SZI0_CERRI|nr:hypothetical protein KP509_17G074500 [Ceratopteris richardii]